MTIRVMVVDDDPMVRRTLANALARSGFDVCTANDGIPALRLAEVTPPDIAVIDLNMPTGGYDFVHELKTRHGNSMFVAVLTGEDCDETRASCLAAGADAVFVKPISSAELRRCLFAAADALKSLRVAS